MWRHHRGLWCNPPGVGGVSMSDQVGHAGHRSSTHRLELLCVLVDGQRSLLVLWHGATVRHHSHHHRPHHVVGLRSAWVLLHMAGSCSKVIVTRYRLCTNIVVYVSSFGWIKVLWVCFFSIWIWLFCDKYIKQSYKVLNKSGNQWHF